MDDQKKYNFNIPGEAVVDGQININLIERTGDAAIIYEPDQFNRRVALAGILAFVLGHNWPATKQDHKAKVLYTADPTFGTPGITLLVNPKDPLADTIHTTLSLNKELLAWGINNHKRFSQDSLKEHVRQYAHHFPEVAFAKTIIESMTTFIYKYEQQVERADDRQGNKDNKYSEALKITKGELPKEFTIKLPLYEKTKPVELTLEIEVDRNKGTNAPEFSFYCLELQPMLKAAAEEEIMTVVNELEKTFVCLEV